MPPSAPAELEYTRPPVTGYQEAAFWSPARYSLIEGTAKAGKNYGGCVWQFERAIRGTRWPNHWWIEPTYAQASSVYERMKIGIPRELRKANDTELSLELINGHKLWYKTGEKPDHLYGDDVGDAVVNEASRVREQAWWAVRSTLTATQGPVRIMGNLKGKKNWFYQLCRKAEAGEPDMAYFRFISMQAVEAGLLPIGEIENAKRILPESIFKELYMGIPSDDGGNPFGASNIEACVAPKSERQPVVYGIDLAKSVDWTVVIGLDALGYVCAFERWQAPWRETIDRILATIGSTKTVIDSTGVGDPVTEEIQRKRPGTVEGFKFTGESKQQLMMGLAAAISGRKIHYPEGAIRDELDSFEYKFSTRDNSVTGVRYAAMEGANDDCVCALALAVSGYTFASVRPVAALSGQTPSPILRTSKPAWALHLRP